MVAKNSSDQSQRLRLLPAYRFTLYKAVGSTASFLGREWAGGGMLRGTATGANYIDLSPHTELVIAEGLLPNDITSPSPIEETATAFPIPGPYILSAETPTGVPGLASTSRTEAMFFAESRVDNGFLDVSIEGRTSASDPTVYYSSRPIHLTVTYTNLEGEQVLRDLSARMIVGRQEGERFTTIFEQPLQILVNQNVLEQVGTGGRVVLSGHCATTIARGTIYPIRKLSSGTYTVTVSVSTAQGTNPPLTIFSTKIISIRGEPSS